MKFPFGDYKRKFCINRQNPITIPLWNHGKVMNGADSRNNKVKRFWGGAPRMKILENYINEYRIRGTGFLRKENYPRYGELYG